MLMTSARGPLIVVALCVSVSSAACWSVEVERGLDESRPLRRGSSPSKEELRQLVERLAPAHRAPDKPDPHGWLAHVSEPGQTFEQYLDGDPTRPAGARRAIYLLPFGELDPQRRRIATLTARYLSIFFCLPARLGRPAPEGAFSTRRHPRWGLEQANAEHALNRVLAPRLPDDAAFMLGVTTKDLYPLASWNYVYGLASLHKRVGLVSMYRMGTPVVGHAPSQRRVMLRTLKIASHESTHMVSAQHCVKYRCNMGGMNYTGELDRRPMALCPECVAKVLWATGCDPVARYRRLARFCRDHGLAEQARRYDDLRWQLTRTK
jgi:archaemetzincin